MICVKCKKEIPEGAPFCCWCGKKQTTTKRKVRRRARGTGSIRFEKRNPKRPYRVYAPGTRHGTSGKYLGCYSTVAEAQAVLDALSQDTLSDLHNATLEEIYALWSETHYANCSESTAAGYKAAYKQFSALYNSRFREIKTADYQRIIDRQASEGASSSKIHKIKLLCGLLCEYAMKNDVIDKNYGQMIRLPKTEKKEKERFSASELDTLWMHSDDKRVQIILVMIYTGFRIGELCALKPSDIHGTYMIGGEKTEAGKNRIVPFPPSIPEIKGFVLSWADSCLTETLLGVSVRQLREDTFYTVLHELGMISAPSISSTTGKKVWNNPRLTPHSTRHTFATLSAEAGMKPENLQKIIGHASFQTTADIYVHKDVEALTADMAKLKR